MTSAGGKTLLVLLALSLAGPAGAASPLPEPGSPAGAVCDRTLSRDPDYVIVPGGLFPAFLGEPIDRMRLYAFRSGQWTPVPFQIDERHPSGRLVCPFGKKPERDEDGGLLDPNDELVFMADDTGDRVPEAAWPPAWKTVQEVQVADPLDQGLGWCCLVLHAAPPPASPVDYIVYVPGEDRYVALYNTAVYMRDGVHRADYNVNVYPPAAGGSGVDITDRLKIRMLFRLRVPPVTVTLDEDDTEVETEAYIDGPVRIVRRNQLYVRAPFLTIPFGGAHDVIVYRDTNDTPIEVTVPRGASWFVKEMEIRLGTDLSPEALGMRWYSRAHPEGVVVDGRMSDEERHLDPDLAPGDRQAYWQVIAGPQGAMMRRGMYDPELEGLFETSVRYVDDRSATDPPEEFPGSIGHASLCIRLKRLEAGTYVFQQQWYHPHHFHPFSPGEVSRYMNIRDHPLTVEVGSGRP